MERRLAAILALDTVEYSRLMSIDETGTYAALKTCRDEVVEPEILNHHGRIVKLTGDGVLAEFASGVMAVDCAIAIQRAMEERSQKSRADNQIIFRIGVNLGDVIVENGDIYGDGVNVAARLESIAEPGGVAIPSAVLSYLDQKLSSCFIDTGEQSLKNISLPVRVWQWSLAPLATTAKSSISSGLPEIPSIAVLAFTNLSSDPEQDYFADGVAEEIINALSRVPLFFVTARNSSFTYKGKIPDVKQVGRELGVRYVLSGSVQKSGQRLRVTAELSDTNSARQIWSNRYQGSADDIFDFQDQIVEAIAGVMEPTIHDAEIVRMYRKRPDSFDAYDHYLRALAEVEPFTREAIDTALDHCFAAIDIDETFSPVLALAARCFISKRVQGWIGEEETAEGLHLAERALATDRSDPFAHAVAGHCYAFFERDLEKGIAFVDKSIALNPNFAWAFLHSGVIRTYAGQISEAIVHFEKAERLSPRDTRISAFQAGRAMALELSGDLSSAYALAKRSVQSQSGKNYAPAWRVLASSAAEIGQHDEAVRAAHHLLQIDPKFSVGAFRDRFPIADPDLFEGMFDALRTAGLPE